MTTAREDVGKFDLNLLIALDALLAERNVTRAARRAWVSQPAMSGSLSRLRKHFNDPLLIREGRDFVLSPFAHSLVEPVATALAATKRAFCGPQAFDPAIDRREFDIIASGHTLAVMLSRVFNDPCVQEGVATISVQKYGEMSPEMLRTGRSDLVVAPIDIDPKLQPFESEILYYERLVLVVAKANKKISASVALDELSLLPFAVSATQRGTILEGYFQRLGLAWQPKVQVADPMALPLLVEGSEMVAVLPERLVRQCSSALRIVSVPVPLPSGPVAMYWHRDEHSDESGQWLRKLVRGAASAMPPLP